MTRTAATTAECADPPVSNAANPGPPANPLSPSYFGPDSLCGLHPGFGLVARLFRQETTALPCRGSRAAVEPASEKDSPSAFGWRRPSARIGCPCSSQALEIKQETRCGKKIRSRREPAPSRSLAGQHPVEAGAARAWRWSTSEAAIAKAAPRSGWPHPSPSSCCCFDRFGCSEDLCTNRESPCRSGESARPAARRSLVQ